MGGRQVEGMTPKQEYLALAAVAEALEREVEDKLRRLPLAEAAEQELREALRAAEAKLADQQAALVHTTCVCVCQRERESVCV